MQNSPIMETTSFPAQLPGQDFLKASHYSISHDDRFTSQSLKSINHRDYLPPREKLKPHPALPPIPSNFMHQDKEKINLKVSETAESYFKKRSVLDDPRDKYSSLYKTNFKMNSDSKISTFQTTQEAHFKPKPTVHKIRSDLGRYWTRSSLPQGDKEKADESISNYKRSFLSHDVATIAKKQTPSRQWQTNTITGDEQQRFETTHESSFHGSALKPPAPMPKHTFSSVPEGDKEKVIEKTTTMKHSYQANEGNYRPQHTTDSHTKLYGTNFDLTDRHGVFNNYRSTQMDSHPSLVMIDSRVKRNRDRNASDIPQGDLDSYRSQKRINSTVARSHHIPYDAQKSMAPRVTGSEKRTASDVTFGEKELDGAFYDTTCNATYKVTSVPYFKAASHPESVVPLNYYGDLKTSSTTFNDFKQHGMGESTSRLDLGNMRATNFDQPFGEEREFITNHDLHFTPKKINKHKVDCGRLHRTSLPMGTLGRYIKGCHSGW